MVQRESQGNMSHFTAILVITKKTMVISSIYSVQFFLQAQKASSNAEQNCVL